MQERISQPSYQEMLEKFQHLTYEEQSKLLDDLKYIHQASLEPRHDITELKGLGKEIWKDIDAQEYVNRERESWGG